MTTETTDRRYTADEIAGMSYSNLEGHLEARQEQLARAERDMRATHAAIAAMSAEQLDGRQGTDAWADLGAYTREAAIQRGIIGQLEDELRARFLGRPATTPPSHVEIEYVATRLWAEGLPGADADEPEFAELTRTIWGEAYRAADAVADAPFTAQEVADRTIGAWLAIYKPEVDEANTVAAATTPPAGAIEPGSDQARQLEREAATLCAFHEAGACYDGCPAAYHVNDPKRVWDIIEYAEPEGEIDIAGQAPGRNATEALAIFNNDACAGRGEVDLGDDEPELRYDGASYRAR